MTLSRLEQFWRSNAAMKSATQSIDRDSSNFRPFSKATNSAHVFNLGSDSGIPHLLSAGRPSTVIAFIVAVIVNAVKLAAFWAHPHVAKEAIKRVKPLIGHLYSPASVMPVLLMFWIRAAIFGKRPRPILFRSPHAMFIPMFGKSQSAYAPTTNLESITNALSLNALRCSTVTLANPVTIRRSAGIVVSDYKQFSEAFSCQVLDATRKCSRFFVSHEPPLRRLVRAVVSADNTAAACLF